jgi:hypothetical protein
MKPKLMNFGQGETYEIPELLQLDLPQPEVHIPRYKIMKVTGSAEFTDSDSSNCFEHISCNKYWVGLNF